MTKERALKTLELLPQLLLGDVNTLILLVKSGQLKEARRLARKLRKITKL